MFPGDVCPIVVARISSKHSHNFLTIDSTGFKGLKVHEYRNWHVAWCNQTEMHDMAFVNLFDCFTRLYDVCLVLTIICILYITTNALKFSRTTCHSWSNALAPTTELLGTLSKGEQIGDSVPGTERCLEA